MTARASPATLPAPRRPDPLDVPALGWGVLGTGWIAERFVRAGLGSPGHGMDRRTIRPRAADLDDPAGRRRRLPLPGLRGTIRRLGGHPDRPPVARSACPRPRGRHCLCRDAAPGPPRECPAG